MHPRASVLLHTCYRKEPKGEVLTERERGRKVRGDTTGVDANNHEPSDSMLLWDCVRVVSRHLKRMARLRPSLRARFRDHTRRVKRRAYEIKFPAAARIGSLPTGI
jgi:hypothetical protein